MARERAVFLGLDMDGLIVFVLLLVTCLPLCWLPWLVDGLKGTPRE